MTSRNNAAIITLTTSTEFPLFPLNKVSPLGFNPANQVIISLFGCIEMKDSIINHFRIPGISEEISGFQQFLMGFFQKVFIGYDGLGLLAVKLQ